MTGCLGCQRCESGPMVALISGLRVCDFCPEWKMECEARKLLKMPLVDRRKALQERERIRGIPSVDRLRQVMATIHAQGKKN